MLEDHFEIFLVTYNRSSFLDNSLRQLKDSPLARCRFTVMDNCSTDETPEIAAKYRAHFSDYRIIRHPRNIGGDANYLRAVELSTSTYTWILCDDDNFDFNCISDVLAAIESGVYDLIYVGTRSQAHLNWKGFGPTTSKQLIRDGARYYHALTFWPALIFRTALFDSECVLKGYKFVCYSYPLFEFINKSVKEDFSLYVARDELIVRFEGNMSEISGLHWYASWLTCCRSITDTKLRATVVDQATERGGFLRSLIFWIAWERTTRAPGFFKRLTDIAFGLPPWHRVKLLLLLPLMIIPIPKRSLLSARRIAYRMMGTTEIPPVETDDRV